MSLFAFGPDPIEVEARAKQQGLPYSSRRLAGRPRGILIYAMSIEQIVMRPRRPTGSQAQQAQGAQASRQTRPGTASVVNPAKPAKPATKAAPAKMPAKAAPTSTPTKVLGGLFEMGYEEGYRITPIDSTIWQSFFGMGFAAGALLFGYSRKRAIEHRSLMV